MTDEDDATFYARVIKRLGRNARADALGILAPDDAARLWRAALCARLTSSQEAAVLMGLRIHGESAAMLAAFVGESRTACAGLVEAPSGPAVVVLYAFGTARRTPCLAALLALQTAARRAPVLIVTHDAGRGPNTAAVLHALGRTACDSAAAASVALREQRLAWWPIESLAPALARLLARRAELGFRNTAQSLVKLLAPVQGPAVVVANYTHAPYRLSFAAAVQSLGLSALLVRGTEGDPVAWEAEAHPSLAWCRGVAQPPGLSPLGLPDPGATGPARPSQGLPAAQDSAATARFIAAAAAGSIAVPAAIEHQAGMLATLAAAAGSAG